MVKRPVRPKLDLATQNEKIFEANAIARAQWKTSNVWVQRIAAILISRIGENETEFRRQIISMSEIIPTEHGGMNYSIIKNLAQELGSQTVLTRVYGTEKDFVVHNVFQSGIRYYEKNHEIEICLNNDLRPFYLELKKNFVAYGLDEFLSLPSTYYQTLYKYIKSWESESYHAIRIEDLHRILNTTKTHRDNYSNLDRKILAPAHECITKFTSLRYDYEPLKEGRKVAHIAFHIHSKPVIPRKVPKKLPKKKGRGGNDFSLKAPNKPGGNSVD